jgi:hypothetical protein
VAAIDKEAPEDVKVAPDYPARKQPAKTFDLPTSLHQYLSKEIKLHLAS